MHAKTVIANREPQPFLRREVRGACRPSHIASTAIADERTRTNVCPIPAVHEFQTRTRGVSRIEGVTPIFPSQKCGTEGVALILVGGVARVSAAAKS